MSNGKKWYEWVTGSLEEKRQYKQQKARVQELPPAYRETYEGVERYLMYYAGLSKGDELLQMLEDLEHLVAQAAADGTPVRELLGDDPVAFAEEFASNYTDSQWINKERDRLTRTIERAEYAKGEDA